MSESQTSEADVAGVASADKDNAARKLLRVLEAVSNPGAAHRLGDLVKETGLAKTSVYRILTDLIDGGYVSRTSDGSYGPGPALRLLALKTTAQSSEVDQVGPRLKLLQADVHSTIHFALRTGDHATYVEKIEDAAQPIKIASRVGAQIPLHSTAIGKAILAHLPESEVRGYAARTGLPTRTVQTITDIDGLLIDGALVRTRGFSIDDEENEEHIRCMAVPVFDTQHNLIGGIGITTIAPLVPQEKLESYAPLLLTAARDVMMLL
ncbi:IclR family transcriptional regulator [Glaciihabitans tibetensis]|uniref:IclR family transcriptional regulator n=1 Tax=Glaciihabitans tibetensis TaxID=1266600 RepID=A0A2T0VE35_9MICO|nr:IclR family transcriptional regulator [Glaciihabitans tibetensis]PRY68447.1 IclR family transcriptional regulator [Glaciihabitans tibetensis]